MNNSKQNQKPLQDGLKYIVSGLPLPVSGFMNYYGKQIPVISLPLMSDYKWQYTVLQDRLKNPEKYREIGEDVEATIERLKAWLTEHAAEATQISA